MATRASTLVTASGLSLPYPTGGALHIEIYRCQGGTAGDTTTITPARGRFIVAAVGGPLSSTTIGTTGTDTQVVFTHEQSAASTSVNFDAVLWIQE